MTYNGASLGQLPGGARPMLLSAPSPKSMEMPAEAQNFTVSGAGPDVGDATKRPGADPASRATAAAVAAIVVAATALSVTKLAIFTE